VAFEVDTSRKALDALDSRDSLRASGFRPCSAYIAGVRRVGGRCHRPPL